MKNLIFFPDAYLAIVLLSSYRLRNNADYYNFSGTAVPGDRPNYHVGVVQRSSTGTFILLIYLHYFTSN